MHVLSKVLLGVVVVMAIVAVILTSKLRLARGHWLQQIQQRQEQVESTSENLRKKELTVAAARDDVNRLMNLWGNAWPSQGQVVNPQLGAVALNIGANSGLGQREALAEQQLPAFYAFAVSPQGQSKYLGEFRPTGIQAGATAAQLTRPPYQGEAQSWPAGPWRIRESIPSDWRSIFAGLQARTAEALQDVQDQNVRLAMAEELNNKSQEQLQRRLGQLDGRPNALEGSSTEVVDGLVASVRKSESARNADLERLDDLRHEYDRKYRQLQSLIAENRELELLLPQPGQSAETPSGDQQAIETSAPTASR